MIGTRFFCTSYWVPCMALVLVATVIAVVLATWDDDDEVDVDPISVTSTDASALGDQSIIIIGAGAAGLFAAYTLVFLGFDNFQILEASDDFGGRVRELNFIEEVPLDAGAEWIHYNPKILQDLLLFPQQQVMVDTIVYNPQTIGYFEDGEQSRIDDERDNYEDWKFKSTTWYSYLEDYVLPFVEDKIVYNTAVSTINCSATHVVKVATTDGRTFEANKVVVAVPAPVLQNGDITFIPEPPPAKIEALFNVEVLYGLKVWFEFDERFYLDFQDFGGLPSKTERSYFDALFGKGIDGTHVLGYLHVGGSSTKLQVEMDEDELISTLIQELDEIFGGQATQHYVRHFVQNWSKQPYTQGAYSWTITDELWTKRELRRPIENKIYFAGEHLHELYQATVVGAALTGRRVAEDMVKDENQQRRLRMDAKTGRAF